MKCHDLFMSYKSIFQDCRDSTDWVHMKVSNLQYNYNQHYRCNRFRFIYFPSLHKNSLLQNSINRKTEERKPKD